MAAEARANRSSSFDKNQVHPSRCLRPISSSGIPEWRIVTSVWSPRGANVTVTIDSIHRVPSDIQVYSATLGYAIAQSIRGRSGQALDIEFGSLYPALKRLEMKGWVDAKWEISEMNRKIKLYRLTTTGRKRLMQEHSKWADFVNAIGSVMGPLPSGGKG